MCILTKAIGYFFAISLNNLANSLHCRALFTLNPSRVKGLFFQPLFKQLLVDQQEASQEEEERQQGRDHKMSQPCLYIAA